MPNILTAVPAGQQVLSASQKVLTISLYPGADSFSGPDTFAGSSLFPGATTYPGPDGFGGPNTFPASDSYPGKGTDLVAAAVTPRTLVGSPA